jgi:CubicO group peptidase (beta-lactamase class C family)
MKNQGATQFSYAQGGALLTLLILTLWCVVALWGSLVTPAGAEHLEVVFLGTLAPVGLILLPLYGLRVRWAYIPGVLIVLAMYGGAVKAIVDQNFFFSWSLYNVVVILVYAAALACAIWSVRVYRERPAGGRLWTFVGPAAFVLAAFVIAFFLSTNSDWLREIMFRLTLNRIERRLDKLDSLEAKIDYLVKEAELPSAAAGIVVNDELVWAEAFGDAELSTVYNIGSVTKPFVATAVLQLYEDGLIDLDADAGDYLPFPLRHPDYLERPITIRMLLSHQSSLAHFTDLYMAYHMGPEMASQLWEKRDFELPAVDRTVPFATFVESYLSPDGRHFTPDAWLPNRPGTGYAYSTVGYDLLTLIVERVSGLPFPEYARAEVFEPLGMADSGFSMEQFAGRVAIPYDRAYGVLARSDLALPVEDVATLGGGGMLSTVPDLAQFVISQLNPSRGEGGILTAETLVLMQRRAVSVPKGQGDLNQAGYGLGLGHLNATPWNCWGHLYNMHGAIGHGGSWFGYGGQMWFVPKGSGGYGIVLLVNTDADFEGEASDLWIFAGTYKMQVLLMEAAREAFAASIG